MISLQALYYYPIKGFSAQPLEQVMLAAGKIFPHDRRFALCHANSAYNAAQPSWQRKREFMMLAHTAEVASLSTALDAMSGQLSIKTAGQLLFQGDVFKNSDRVKADLVFTAALKDARGPVRLIDAGDIALTDVEPPYISIINLASVRDLSAKIGAPIESARFRGNIFIDGAAPWSEFDWLGRTLPWGGAALKPVKRIQRCAATSVNPGTAVRDVDVPAALRQHYGHMDFGIYAEVITGGLLRRGASLRLP